MARRRGARGLRGRAAPTAAGPASTTTASTVVDWTHKLGDPASTQPDDPLRVRLRRPARRRSTARPATIERVVAVHDVGRAVNPLLCEGQIEGTVHMGLGYALTEDFPTDPETGFPTNMTLRQLGILRAKDVPRDRRRCSSRCPSRRSPYGIKGVGEIGLVPTAPAPSPPRSTTSTASGAPPCR